MLKCSLSRLADRQLEFEDHLHTQMHACKHDCVHTRKQKKPHSLKVQHTVSPLWSVFWHSKVNLIVYHFPPLWTRGISCVAKQQAQFNYRAKEFTAEQLMRIQKTRLQMPDVIIDKNECLWFKWIEDACNSKWGIVGQHNSCSVLHSISDLTTR